MHIKIAKSAFYAPEVIETADDVALKVGKSRQWIINNTGVSNRHICQTSTPDMARRVISAMANDVSEVDLLINASTTPHQAIPDSSAFILKELNWRSLPSFTIHGTCLSFLVGLHVASALINSGAYRRIVVVSSERNTIERNFDEPESAALLGDAAAGVVVEAPTEGEGSEIIAADFNMYVDGISLAQVSGFGVERHPNDPKTTVQDNLFHMDGKKIYKFARMKFANMLDRLFTAARISPADINLVVPHQPSGPALLALRYYGFEPEKVINIIGEYGNCAAASLPTALAIAMQENRIKKGDYILMAGTGAGISVGGMIIRW